MSGTYQNENFSEEVQETVQQENKVTVISSESNKKKFAEASPSLLEEMENSLKNLNQSFLRYKKNKPFAQLDNISKQLNDVYFSCQKLEKLSTGDNNRCLKKVIENQEQILKLVGSVFEKQEKNDRQLLQCLRDNATFQIQVRQGMQQDLEVLKKQLKGEQFNPLLKEIAAIYLKEIAAIYVEYYSLLDDKEISGHAKKNLISLFEQLEDILRDYGAEIYRSEIGSSRKTRVCKIIGKVATDQKEKHNTIALSRRPGVIRNRNVLSPEFVDVYVYDPNLETTVYVNNTSSIINLKKLPNSGVKDISVNQHAVAENEKSDKKMIYRMDLMKIL